MWQVCKKVYYCDKECQKTAWNTHKFVCKPPKLNLSEIASQNVFALNPECALSHIELAKILFEKDQLENAEEAFRNAIALDPSQIYACRKYASDLIDASLVNAEKAFKIAIKIDPKDAQSYMLLGSVLLDLNKIDEAILATKKSIEIKPFELAYKQLIWSYEHLNKLDKAVETCRQLTKLIPGNAEPLNTLGSLLFKSWKLDEAKEILNEAVKIDSSNDYTFTLFGAIYSKSASIYNENNDFENEKSALINGKTYLLRAIEINPRNAWAYSLLSTIAIQSDQLENSAYYMQKAAEIDPKYKDNLDQLLIQIRTISHVST